MSIVSQDYTNKNIYSHEETACEELSLTQLNVIKPVDS